MLGFFSLYCRSLTWKRDDGLVLVGSWFGEKFADNSRYLYQYLFENKEKLGLKKVVWVTRKKSVLKELVEMGYECYMMDSQESIYYHKHAGWHIVCNSPIDLQNFKGDINGSYSYGAKCVNLWHGIGLKGVSRASNEYRLKATRHRFLYAIKDFISSNLIYVNKLVSGAGEWSNNYILSTTNPTTLVFQKYFGLKDDRFIPSSYPRNCKVPRLLKNEENALKLIMGFKHKVLYLPTFRTGNDKLDFSGFGCILKDILIRNDILWIQKPHSADKENKPQEGLQDNILNLAPDFDINMLLPYIDILVTDYSSVLFDAMYHNKPVLYLVPDYDEYKNGDRGFVVSPDEVMQGPKFYSINELKEKLVYYCENPEQAKYEKYSDIRSKYWGQEERTIEDIWNNIKKHISNYQ